MPALRSGTAVHGPLAGARPLPGMRARPRRQRRRRGAAALIILVLGGIVVGLAFRVEFTFAPPLWVHALIWPALTIPAAILMMRVVKAGLVAAQFRYRADEMGL